MRHQRTRLRPDREITRQLAVVLENETNQFGARVADPAVHEVGSFASWHGVVSFGLQRDGLLEPAAGIGKYAWMNLCVSNMSACPHAAVVEGATRTTLYRDVRGALIWNFRFQIPAQTLTGGASFTNPSANLFLSVANN
jgi:hypothetical protein